MTYDLYYRYPACVDALMFAADLRSPINCVIRNVSEGGALLALDHPVQLPKRIYLALHKGAQVIECEVRWRKSNRLFGVRFSDSNSPETRRARVQGKLLSPDLGVSIDCVIRDVSEGGVFLTTRTAGCFADRVYLWQPQAGAVECTIRWRKHNRLFGLRFADTASPDSRRALIEQCVARDALQPERPSPFTSWPGLSDGPTGSVVPFDRPAHGETAVCGEPAHERSGASTGAVVIDIFTRKRHASVSPSTQATQWLEAIGFVVVDADGNWRKTEICEAELTRLRLY